MSTDDIAQIKVDQHSVGIMGLKQILEEMANGFADSPDEEVKSELLKRLSKKNYIPNLKLLEDADLVYSRKDGLWVNYFLSEKNQSPYAASILGNLRHWLEDDPQVTAVLQKLSMIQGEALSMKRD